MLKISGVNRPGLIRIQLYVYSPPTEEPMASGKDDNPTSGYLSDSIVITITIVDGKFKFQGQFLGEVIPWGGGG